MAKRDHHPFVVHCRDEEFALSESQIKTDSPNYFTNFFLGSFKEGKDHQASPMVLDRNPELFAVIVEYLSGYPVLPLSRTFIKNVLDEQIGRAHV